MYVYLCLSICMHVSAVPQGGQKRESDFPESGKLKTFQPPTVILGNGTWVLCERVDTLNC